VSGHDEPNLALIGYPSRQDGAILPAWDKGFVPQGKFTMFWCFILYNKSFIDQACLVKMAGYWPHSVMISLGPCGKQNREFKNLRLITCLTTARKHILLSVFGILEKSILERVLFIINILFYPQSAFNPWSAVCILHWLACKHGSEVLDLPLF